MRTEVFLIDYATIESGGVGESIEIWVIMHIQLNILHLYVGLKTIVVPHDFGCNPWKHLDAFATIFEVHDCDDMPTRSRVNRLLALYFRSLVRNGEVSAKLLVDAVHDVPKEETMRTGVLQLIHAYVVVDHLVNDGIFDYLFRQIYSGVDAKAEVEVLLLSVRKYAHFVRALSQESLRIAQFDGKFGETSFEHLLVELIKLLFDVWYCCFHLIYYCTQLSLGTKLDMFI